MKEQRTYRQLLEKYRQLEQELADLKEQGHTMNEKAGEYRRLFNQMQKGYAFHQIILDKMGKPEDSVFLDVNHAFEEITGLKRERILNQRVTEVLPGIKQEEASWIAAYGEVALKGTRKTFEEYSGQLGKWFHVTAFSPFTHFFIAVFEDITERKRAEAAWKKQEHEKMLVLEHAAEMVAFHDTSHRIIWVNKAYERNSGKRLEDLKHQPCYHAWGFDHACEACPVTRALKTGKPEEGELTPENQKHWTWERGSWVIRAVPVRDRNDRLTGVIELAFEITVQKHLEAQIRESERQVTTLMGNLPGMAYRCINDQHWTMLYVSKGSYDLTGYQPEALMQSTEVAYGDLVHPDDSMQVWNTVQKALEKGRHFEVEYRIITRENKEKWVWERGIGLAGKGDQMQLEGFISDITQRKAAEKALKKSEQKYRLLYNSIRDAILVTDKERTIIDCNSAFSSIFGYTRQEVLGRKTSYIYANNEDYKDLGEKIYAYFGQKAFVHTVMYRKKSGELFPGETSVFYYQDEHSNVTGYIGLIRDVSERHEAENKMKKLNEELQQQNEEYLSLNEELTQTNDELMKAKEKAEESDYLKSAFLANMSHEIRTPLNGILGFTGLLRKSTIDERKKGKYIDIIERNGKRMLTMINDIIDISRIETGLSEITTTAVNINQQMDELYEFFLPEAESLNLHLHYEKGLSDKEAIISTDQEKFYAIFNNLLKNALKYTKEGRIAFGYKRAGNELDFFVEDTGIGISQERQKAIFDRFVQEEAHYTKTQEGSGLGLAITKAYVEMLGGKITLHSEKGKGTRFSFKLPYQTIPSNSA